MCHAYWYSPTHTSLSWIISLPFATCFYTCLSFCPQRGLTQCMLGYHPTPGAGTPPEQAPPLPGRRLLLQTVHILLEWILVHRNHRKFNWPIICTHSSFSKYKNYNSAWDNKQRLFTNCHDRLPDNFLQQKVSFVQMSTMLMPFKLPSEAWVAVDTGGSPSIAHTFLWIWVATFSTSLQQDRT